jgi:hypothetical protein
LTTLKKFSQSSWGCLYIQARAQTPSAFHTPNEHNSSHKKTAKENFNKRGQLISTLTRTFYEASAE